MNRNRLVIIGCMALVVAGLLTYLLVRAFQTKLAAGQRPMTTVVVAATDLPVGTKIQSTDVRVESMPSATLPDGTISSLSDAVGRGVILPIKKNEQVLESKLASTKAGSGLPTLIPEKMRAVSVKVNDVISVAGFVVPGTHVDVLVTGYPAQRQSEGDAMTTTVLSNVEVLASGKDLQQNPDGGKPQQVTVITLLVTPEDAQKLALVGTEGKIQLALRNPLDGETPKLFAVKNASLYKGQPELVTVKTPKGEKRMKKSEVPPPPPVYVVETIRGTKRDSVKF